MCLRKSQMNKLEKIYKRLPGRIEKVIDRIIKRREGGEYFSTTLRKLYKGKIMLEKDFAIL